MRAIVASACLLALGGYWLNFSSGVDDAHISFWMGRAWAQLGAPLNYNLEPVEQSSSLLHALLIAAVERTVGGSPIFVGHVLPLIAALLCLPALAALARQARVAPPPALLLCASSAAFVYWSFAGLEAALVALALLVMSGLWLRWLEDGGGAVAVALAASCLCAQLLRPELPLMLPALGLLAVVVLPAERRGRLLAFAIGNAVIAAGITLCRRAYFGDAFPQPVYAKVSLDSLAQLRLGWQYLRAPFAQPWTCAQSVAGAVAVAYFLLATVRRTARPAVAIAVLLVCLQAGFAVAVGGDWMQAYRFWAPVVPFYALLVAGLLARWLPRRAGAAAVAALVLLNLGSVYDASHRTFGNLAVPCAPDVRDTAEAQGFDFFERRSDDNRANIPTIRSLLPLTERLLAIQPSGVTVLSGQMGMVAYHLAARYAGRVRFIDARSLVERTLTHCPQASRLLKGRGAVASVLTHRASLQSECGMPRPDVVFDLWWNDRVEPLRAILARNGYVVVFDQIGHLTPNLSQFIAVREELWRALGEPAPATYRTPCRSWPGFPWARAAGEVSSPSPPPPA